jgi:hypothetical protein
MLWFLKLGFKEMTSPKELGKAVRVRWFQKGNEKVTFMDNQLALHKHNLINLRWEGIVLQYGKYS